MAGDPMSNRFAKRQKNNKLHQLAEKSRDKDDVEQEKELVEKTEKVEPIRSEAEPKRNDPCPCGSGRKYKKCCG